MQVVYDKLFKELKRQNLTIKKVQDDTGISSSIMNRLRHNTSVTTDTIGKICNYLHVQPSDIMDVLYDGVSYEEYEKQQKIAELEAELAKLKNE